MNKTNPFNSYNQLLSELIAKLEEHQLHFNTLYNQAKASNGLDEKLYSGAAGGIRVAINELQDAQNKVLGVDYPLTYGGNHGLGNIRPDLTSEKDLPQLKYSVAGRSD